ncbi:hypothetical protein M427DRAFT_37781 [Gonapodya prolifera JEL478]|uniref:Hemicentin-1-like von Willebrand factor A domain-containing protein n=1 Tax=Gonapodya prolifera (strain JEL478) TaxID=1344416 RepID=A0A139A044_GONPJ|nr:hypothetical protein M427DRAFT_37781 [Gonapodya prolifera JEL478]|eukprot:KXS10129.1 hypothetical protein M427DRAFT_37781 [Gonapodya prolifera JEL478]
MSTRLAETLRRLEEAKGLRERRRQEVDPSVLAGYLQHNGFSIRLSGTPSAPPPSSFSSNGGMGMPGMGPDGASSMPGGYPSDSPVAYPSMSSLDVAGPPYGLDAPRVGYADPRFGPYKPVSYMPSSLPSFGVQPPSFDPPSYRTSENSYMTPPPADRYDVGALAGRVDALFIAPPPEPRLTRAAAVVQAPNASGPSFLPPPIESYTSTPPLPAATDLFARQRAARDKANAETAAQESQGTAVDVCYVLDCTGSMQAWIDQAKTKIIQIMDELQKMHKGTKLNVAFIGYRDFEDVEPMIFIDFCDPATLAPKIQRIEADGGGDAAEDVMGALVLIPKLSWWAKSRLVIHIADAPPHGKALHDLGADNDRYWDTPDPSGNDGTNLILTKRVIADIVGHSIDYYFFRINNYTDKMVNVFREEHKKLTKHQPAGISNFHEQKMSDGAEQFLPATLQAISTSMRKFGRKPRNIARAS